jgi:hypothetical protein
MITKTYELDGTYGSNETECIVFVVELHTGLKWYCVENSCNVNATYDDLENGVNVEMVEDVDCFTTNPVESLEQLENKIDEL